MKNYLFLLLIPFAFTLNSCGALSTTPSPTLDRWIERTIPPSQVTSSGAMFFEEDLTKDIYNDSFVSYSVGGYIEGDDGKYWYNQLMQDLGWRTNLEGNWSAVNTNSTRVKNGYLYINLKKRVAVYIRDEGFSAFRVTLNERETK
jgi:hypothetical protein